VAPSGIRGVFRRPAQDSLSLVRRRAQPATVAIVRLTCTAVAAFLVARTLTHTPSPIVAPLTALLVIQVTLSHTLRSALQRVLSVVAGVLVALTLSVLLGFTWWSLGVTIAAALAVGYVLQLADVVLEVPISAMLILSLPTEAAVTARIFETLIGAATGLASNLVFAPLRLQPAEEAIDEISGRLAQLLDQIADDLAAGIGPQRTGAWVDRARVLTGEFDRVAQALGQAEESVKLNPRGTTVIDPRIYLRHRLEVLDHVTLTVRGIARSLNDSVGLTGEVNPVSDPAAAEGIADLLRDLAVALRAFGRLARSKSVDRDALKSTVDRHLAEAGEHQGEVDDVLRPDPAPPSSGWPLRGELLAHLDRLRGELHPPPQRRDRPVRAVEPETWGRRLRDAAHRRWPRHHGPDEAPPTSGR
jgi:hypothetical protein